MDEETIKANEELLKQVPFELNVHTLIIHEALGIPITLKNGAKMYPEGWLKFFKLKPEDIPVD
jgi:hypothetical protein